MNIKFAAEDKELLLTASLLVQEKLKLAIKEMTLYLRSIVQYSCIVVCYARHLDCLKGCHLLSRKNRLLHCRQVLVRL